MLVRLRNALRRRRRPEVVVDRAYRSWMRDLSVPPCAKAPSLVISVVVPVRNTPPGVLLEAIASVQAQTHQAWELCIADDASDAPQLGVTLSALVASDARIKVIRLPLHGGIAAASNAGLSLATGDFVAFMDHDDTLAPHALARLAAVLGETPELDMLFSDEDQLDGTGGFVSPYFKPGWNPDLLLGQNFVCHLACYRRSLIDELGGFREGFDGSQDYDLALRAVTLTPARRIRHLADVLYHWRQSAGSYSAGRAGTCQEAARRALGEHLQGHALVLPNRAAPQWSDAMFHLPEKQPLVSIIFAGQGRSLRDRLYRNVEVIVSRRWSNAESARGTVLVFAGEIVADTPGWLGALVGNALRPGVGCAGARIDDSSGRILHSGYVVDPTTIARTLSPGSDADDPGYRGHFCLMRTVSAVSAECFAIRRDIFLDVGGFDRRAGAYADVDLALRLEERNLRCVWVPLARARAKGRLIEADDPDGAAYMRERWQHRLAFDPYFNPNLMIRHGQLGLKSSVSERQVA